ncbi:MAG TPA: NAD-dependent epimerase/dehydratase family protein [Polyangiaceae bacterium]|nr:NAD-dependent epimerase/dehydratase family protein [Polyangiaceae bacterium]
MPRAFVTGGTGFVGGHLVRALVARGWHVTVAHRPTSSRRGLAGLDIDYVTADVTDRAAVQRGMPDRPAVVFHLAANVGFWRGRNAEQTRVNVTGTRHVVDTALQKNAERFVHVSSVAAWGPKDGDVLDESCPIRTSQHWINYARSKWQSELEVDRGVARGLHAVIVNPSHIMGPGDHKNWGRLFGLARHARVVAAPTATAPWCHVADVVHSLIAAAERGSSGQRYLLGGPEVSYHEVLRLVRARMRRAPPLRVAGWVLRAAAHGTRVTSFVARREPRLTPELASIWSTTFRIDDRRAQRELGHGCRPFEAAVDDTFRWVTTQSLDVAP